MNFSLCHENGNMSRRPNFDMKIGAHEIEAFAEQLLVRKEGYIRATESAGVAFSKVPAPTR
jgi:hypothetical protein